MISRDKEQNKDNEGNRQLEGAQGMYVSHRKLLSGFEGHL